MLAITNNAAVYIVEHMFLRMLKILVLRALGSIGYSLKLLLNYKCV